MSFHRQSLISFISTWSSRSAGIGRGIFGLNLQYLQIFTVYKLSVPSDAGPSMSRAGYQYLRSRTRTPQPGLFNFSVYYLVACTQRMFTSASLPMIVLQVLKAHRWIALCRIAGDYVNRLAVMLVLVHQ